MANLAAVIALLALGAVPAHVAETTARVASGLASSSITTTTVATTASAIAATTVSTALRAVAGNVTPLATLVALLTSCTSHAGATLLGALTADVAGTTAAVAGLLSLRVLALAAHVSLFATVVAGWGALSGAVGSAVRRVSAVVAATAASASSWCLVFHFSCFEVGKIRKVVFKGYKWRESEFDRATSNNG